MTHAIVLFKAAESDKWTKIRTVVFYTRRTTIETVQLESHTIELHHTVQAGHKLLLTDGDERVVVAPTGGNEPDDTVPKTMFDLPVVGHYDIRGPEGETYRLYHQRPQEERR